MSSSREVKLLLAMMNREEIERKIKALEAEHKSLNAELYSTRVVYPVKGSRTANEGKRHHHENSSKGANASQPRLKRRHNHTGDIHPTKIRLSTNKNADSKHPMKQICVFPNNSARQESPISPYSNQTESKKRSLSRESKGKTRSPTNSTSPERKPYKIPKIDFQSQRGRQMFRSPTKEKKRSGSRKYRSPSSSASPPRYYTGKSCEGDVQQRKRNRSPSSSRPSSGKHTRFSSLVIEQSPIHREKLKPDHAIPQKKMKETSSPANPAKLKSIIKPKNKELDERKTNKIQSGEADLDQFGDGLANISLTQEQPGNSRSSAQEQSGNCARTTPYARKQDNLKPELKNNNESVTELSKPGLKNDNEPVTDLLQKQQPKPETSKIENDSSAPVTEDQEQQNQETKIAILGIVSDDSDPEQDIDFTNHSLFGSVTFPELDQQSSQEFNDLFANLNAYQETISIPPQVAANDSAVPAQIDAQQEEFAEIHQEAQPGFLLQPSQENLSGAVPTEPSASESISQLNSDPQARVITPQDVALPVQFSTNSSNEQEAATKTAHGTDPIPVQLTSPSGKEPSPSSVPTSVSSKTVAGKRPYRKSDKSNECTTRWTIPQFVTQEFIPFRNEFETFKNICKSRHNRIIELINEKSANANRQFGTLISQMNSLNLNQ